MSYRFLQVDVFTESMFGGNALAVFPDAQALSSELMQSLALEMNLSETTFVLPSDDPSCVARVRIFTPGTELPFAGHPTIGTAFVLARLGRVLDRHFAFQEGVGSVPVRLEGDLAFPSFVWMRHPPAVFGSPLLDRAAIAETLGLEASDLLDHPVQVGSTGVPFVYVPVRDRATVDRAYPTTRDLDPIDPDSRPQGFFVFAPQENGAYSRMFGATSRGISEDPATGGASGALGAYLLKEGFVPSSPEMRMVSHQGVKMGRPSSVHILVETEGGVIRRIEVGGSVVPVLEGIVSLDSD